MQTWAHQDQGYCLRIGDNCFNPIKKIAEDFRASLTATAIKFVRLCSEQCAIVFSSDGKIQWSYRSEDWWPFIQRGKNLDERTVAFDLFNNKQLPDEPVGIDGDAWVENDGVDLIVEHYDKHFRGRYSVYTSSNPREE